MVDKILSDEYPYQDTVSVSTWVLIKQLQTWYLNVYIRRAKCFLVNWKVWAVSAERKTMDLATSVDGSEYHLLGYSACSFNPYNAAIVKEAYSSVTPS
jgi:hypothetical protein